MDQEDEIIKSIPIHYSNRLSLQPQSRIQEIHVPADTRPEVWNGERGHEFGKGQLDDDREKNQERKGKGREGEEPRLAEIRMRSEEITQRGAQMLGILHNNQLHMHPIDSTHQFRPTLTYLDILSRKSKRRKDDDSDSDSDDGPPPDPGRTNTAKEVQVSARRVIEDKAGNLAQLMLAIIRAEQDESWRNLEFCDMEKHLLMHLTGFWSYKNENLHCSTDITTFLRKK
ncbi:hypothetical protein BT96DRAFT_952799 [Gymnopus androsaceus JB14]|uniref:Uncharacterized protein n=1 Tax=Gymnopus androsaceus JB14 TaxID=1447944 RepID=A0A6A4IF60_9AGAR|nr:hypothetical protein BT96DRAFT_952799 [Gymnopus androsaceus JB14]